MKLKRIHLFEIEDQSWFPDWIRDCMTKLIVVMHGFFGTKDDLANLVAKVLKQNNSKKIIDLCSGGGGPMIDVMKVLEEKHGLKNIPLTLTDLYPNKEFANHINQQKNPNFTYQLDSVDATKISAKEKGLRTMICSFHHMRPKAARQILENAQNAQEPICIFEISDNSAPIFAWIIAFPINFIMCLFVTLKVRPMTWQQIIFTYPIPIIPLCFAWDGAISNSRTYTIKDMETLIQSLPPSNYKWETGAIPGKPSAKLYLIGNPG